MRILVVAMLLPLCTATTTTTTTTTARDYRSALNATGCPNPRPHPSAYWDSLPWSGVYSDMHIYCLLVKDRSANPYQYDLCCGAPTCTVKACVLQKSSVADTSGKERNKKNKRTTPKSFTYVWIVPVIATLVVLLLVAIIVPLACLCCKRQDKDIIAAPTVVEMTQSSTKPKANVVAGADTAFWYEEDDESEYQNPIALKCLRRNLYSIKMPPEELQLPPQPMDKRTFASSNYRVLYETARCFADTSELLIATKHMVRNYARKQNRRWQAESNPNLDDNNGPDGRLLRSRQRAKETSTCSTSNSKLNGRDFFEKLVKEASKDASVWQNLSGGAELLWTSGKQWITDSSAVEFCGMINAAIREDDPLDLIHLVMIARGINNRVVHRGEDAKAAQIEQLWAEKFPKDGIVYRGGSFDNAVQSFFIPGKKYRVPGYLATSLSETVATSFVIRATDDMPRVLWKIAVDKRGITNPVYRCRHAFVLEMTHIPGEEEYLFVPYSTFTVLEASWSENFTQPHEIMLEASMDNLVEDSDLPLAPWY